ncbi:hypothetical protein M3P36_07900 [Altererythrobacter sp. KTW20L]|uniref:hypothetical protein n=1 Tax=Altererythrobacter sp. KTW20L TaxID=2942210 RepID=UPI0020BDC19D|nr:hypothetical protein [Altererythrobacter sp. KTW20L]MCL6250961.1 hypothetical protein [Altererythrobacter sp. KTW20L]
MKRSLIVRPQNGWGWTDGKATVDEPAAFRANLLPHGEGWVGEVEDGPYMGWRLDMSKRHAGEFDGLVNVLMQDSEGKRKLSGYAEISRDLMDV